MKKDTVRYTAKELQKARKKDTGTDWERLKQMSDEDAEENALSDPEDFTIDPGFWEHAQEAYSPPNKEKISIRLDQDVVAFFKEQGRGYQSRINAVLRSYMDSLSKKN